MKFDPKLADANLLPEDWYDALIVYANEQTSKKGNPMLMIGFRIYDHAGTQPIIDRYFVLNTPSGLTGLRKLCRAVGLDQAFSQGDMDASLLQGKSVRTLVKIQEDETGQYDSKNVCAAFEPPGPGTGTGTKPSAAVTTTNDDAFDPTKDDGIPF